MYCGLNIIKFAEILLEKHAPQEEIDKLVERLINFIVPAVQKLVKEHSP